MTVFGHSTVVFLAGKQVLPVDYEAEFKTYVTALFVVAHTGSLALVKKLLGFAAVLLSCENVKASNNRVISPGTSPNTDGIHVTATRNIEILSSVIRTGDDCISIPSFDEHQYHSEPRFTSAANPQQTKRECSKYLNGLTSKEEDIFIEEPATKMSEHFQGFLSIGTLGSDPSIAEAMTPKFSISCRSVNEKENEVTVTELMLINDELEKFLEAEAKDVDYDSSERSSFVSTITLSNYHTEENDAEENENMVACPLQQYLFSSSIECPQTGEEMKKDKGSLGKLFANDYKDFEQRKEQNKEEGIGTKGTRALEFMKKMFNKIYVTSRSSNASANDHAVVTVSTKRKLFKVLRLLQRRIHPDISVSGQKVDKSCKCEDRTKNRARGATILEKGSHNFPKPMLKDKVKTVSSNHDSLDSNHSTGTVGHWIKTDTDSLEAWEKVILQIMFQMYWWIELHSMEPPMESGSKLGREDDMQRTSNFRIL